MADLSTLETIKASDKPTENDFSYIYAESANKAFIRIAKEELKKLILDGEYTNEEIDQKISTIPKFTTKVVSSLPTTDISDTTVYLVSSGDDSENLYTEYININGLWEILGTQKSTFSGSASDVTYDDTETKLGATNVQDAFGKLSATVNNQREDIANKELSGTAEAKVAEHNVSEESHSDIRLLIDNLSELVTSLLDSDDETLNQTSEIVAYVKSNKSLIDSITTSKVNVSDIIDNLTTNVSNKPLSAKQGVVLKGLIDTLQAELSKITIPTTLPNPYKLIFQGAVTAEYDGSGAVTVTIPTAGGGSVTERIEKLSTDTEVELQPNKLYIFPEMATLTYTLAEISDNSVLNEYHFVFQSGATATEVVHPESVNIGSFAVEANKIYEISIMEGLLTSQSWAVS